MLRMAAAAPVLVGMPAVVSSLTAPVARAQGLAGAVIFLDPGHSGATDGTLTKQVPTGRGGTKDCQTSGTSTNTGFTEHAFAWQVSLRVRQLLMNEGARVQLSRDNDSAMGACVDQRAAMANALHANAVVSIHADGGPAGGHGFHVNYSAPPLNQVQAGPSVRFAQIMRDQMVATGMTPATYIGSGGLYGRSDLAGLNLAQCPSILVECGNMKNDQDAALMTSEQGQQTIALAIGRGIQAFLQQS